MPDDIASAARSLATRFAAAKDAGHTDIALRMSEAAALLPILNAVAGGAGADRVEKWARAMCLAAGHDPDASFGPEGRALWESFEPQARAAMAIADAERAAEAEATRQAVRDSEDKAFWSERRRWVGQ